MKDDEAFDAISHPLRVKILQKLSEKPMGLSELKRELGIGSSGKLDFHFKKLGELITTDDRGRYTLTREGYAALQAVDVIKNYRWQRRAYHLNLAICILLNLYFAATDPSIWLQIVLPTSTIWIAFYTYWTVIKRRAFRV